MFRPWNRMETVLLSWPGFHGAKERGMRWRARGRSTTHPGELGSSNYRGTQDKATNLKTGWRSHGDTLMCKHDETTLFTGVTVMCHTSPHAGFLTSRAEKLCVGQRRLFVHFFSTTSHTHASLLPMQCNTTSNNYPNPKPPHNPTQHALQSR
jgi:hypothetical protein